MMGFAQQLNPSCVLASVNQYSGINRSFAACRGWYGSQCFEARKMLDTIIVASGVLTAFSLVFLSLFMHFGRDWNGR